METKLNLKYSEFLLQVAASTLIDREAFICPKLQYQKRFNQYPEYCKKLKASINRKLREIEKLMPHFAKQNTLTFLNRVLKLNVGETEARIIWLKSLSTYHAKRGN